MAEEKQILSIFFNFCAQISPICKQKIQPFFFFFFWRQKILKVRSKLIPKWNENPRLTIWRNLVRQFSIFAYIADFEVSRSTLWVFLTHPLSLSSSWLSLQNRIDYGLNFTLLPKLVEIFKILSKMQIRKKNPTGHCLCQQFLWLWGIRASRKCK